jgi:hypothetical protein
LVYAYFLLLHLDNYTSGFQLDFIILRSNYLTRINSSEILITGTMFFYFTLYRASNKMMVVYSVNSLTLHSKTDVTPLGYYPDFEPTSPCSYSIMMGA